MRPSSLRLARGRVVQLSRLPMPVVSLHGVYEGIPRQAQSDRAQGILHLRFASSPLIIGSVVFFEISGPFFVVLRRRKQRYSWQSTVYILVAVVPHLFLYLEYSRFLDPQQGQNIDRIGCPNCQRTYKDRKQLFQHLRSGTGCDKPKLGDCLPADGRPLLIYQCPSCPYVSYIKGFLQKHLRVEHNIQNNNIQKPILFPHLPCWFDVVKVCVFQHCVHNYKRNRIQEVR